MKSVMTFFWIFIFVLLSANQQSLPFTYLNSNCIPAFDSAGSICASKRRGNAPRNCLAGKINIAFKLYAWIGRGLENRTSAGLQRALNSQVIDYGFPV
jgi:hypothetical protein